MQTLFSIGWAYPSFFSLLNGFPEETKFCTFSSGSKNGILGLLWQGKLTYLDRRSRVDFRGIRSARRSLGRSHPLCH